MPANGGSHAEHLNALVAGMVSLRHDGRFDEPNLDGSAGDYISFNSWEWPQGAGLFGLVRLWQHNRDAQLLRTLEGWYERQINAGLPKLNVNTTAPMFALSVLWGETREARWAKVLDRWADQLISTMPRTPEGGFEHSVSDKINKNELWADTLFMAALFLASYGQLSGRRDLVDEAERQFLVHGRYLADPHSGLWYHGWTFEGRHNFARAFWGRGNAWTAISIVELLDLAEIRPSVRACLLGILETHITALQKLQTPSGAWRTLLDDPTSYEEMSATAGIGYAFLKAARLGIGPAGCRPAGLRALEAVKSNVTEQGTLSNVSYGTRMGHDLQFYHDIPFQPTGYGQALAILCLTEGLINDEAKEVAA
ncbi:MAG: glycoside hydrolase family 105 protein [Alphaproteobacteria bacterium]|nr:glycoside hydrolase family 105 protein [Alphaproteobacteria bacterium]